MLFDIIPENFFMPLAAPGKIAYWDCICRLFSISSGQLSFGVERSILVDELQYYFESSMAADFQVESDGASAKDKANSMLRKLENYGWIYTEVESGNTQKINFRDYAIQVIRTLLSVSDRNKVEYQGYIYTIYNLVKASSNPGLGLLQIKENMEALVTGLKSLNANIKKYLEDLTQYSTVQEILNKLLNDYYTNVVDKAYHRLITSDNVSKFRPEIMERLDAWSRDQRFLDAASKEIAQLQEISEGEAREKVLEYLHGLMNDFRQIDEILEEINKKNTQYQKAAISRAQFKLLNSGDVRGQLKDILSWMNQEIQKKSLDYNAVYELEEMDNLIQIFSLDYLDIDSLYSPKEGKKEFKPKPQPVIVVDEKARHEKRQKLKEQLERKLTVEKISLYVEEQLAGRKEMLASELPLDQKDTYIRMVHICMYGNRKNMRYRIEMLDDVNCCGFHFQDFKIIAKR